MKEKHHNLLGIKESRFKCKLNPGSFYKIKKQITKQAEVKTAVVDNKGNLLTNKQLIVNEY